MIRIIATEEQAKKIAEARESVEIVDTNGKRLGYFARPFSETELRIARERLASDEERRPTTVVINRLHSLKDA
jgi:hypothetical protein